MKRYGPCTIKYKDEKGDEYTMTMNPVEAMMGEYCLLADACALLDVAKKALEFYGDVKNYKPDTKLLHTPLIYDDYGKIAREALERWEEMEK